MSKQFGLKWYPLQRVCVKGMYILDRLSAIRETTFITCLFSLPPKSFFKWSTLSRKNALMGTNVFVSE